MLTLMTAVFLRVLLYNHWGHCFITEEYALTVSNMLLLTHYGREIDYLAHCHGPCQFPAEQSHQSHSPTYFSLRLLCSLYTLNSPLMSLPLTYTEAN